MRGVRARRLLSVGLLALPGCAHSMQRSETLYQEHRYIEAAEAFERTEDRLPTWSLDERASYGLYRGLTFLHLDDLSSARRWLGYAYAVEHDAPGSLPREDRALLDRGWTELDQRVRAAGVERGPDRAVAETAPDERSTPLAPSNGRRSLVVP